MRAPADGTWVIQVEGSEVAGSMADFVLTVDAVNDAPTISNITDRSTPQDTATPAIAFTVGSRDQIKVDTYPSSFQTGYSRRGYYYGYNYGTETRVRQYTEGQLAVDVFDVASHNPAFHGVASKKITDSDRENQQEVLNAIVAEALSGFPLAGGAVLPAQ